MSVENIALAISIISVIIASLSLGWNIYRDVILKPRIRVSFSVATLFHQSFPHKPKFLNLTVTNFGPGCVTISTITAKEAQLWRHLLGTVKYAVIMHDYTNSLSSKLPAKIEVGDKIELLLPYDNECFLKMGSTHVGVYDYYGRAHWASRREVREAARNWNKDFPSEAEPSSNS